MPQFDSYLFRGLLFFSTGQLLASSFPGLNVLPSTLFMYAILMVFPFLFIKKKIVYEGIGFFLLLLCGAWLNRAYYQVPADHYSSQNKKQIHTIRVDKVLKENPYAYRYYASIQSVGKTATSGKIVLLQERDSLVKPFVIGTRFVTLATPKKIEEPKNPGAFDYAAYLKNQKIQDQLYLKANTYIVLAKQKAEGFHRLYEWRTRSIQKIRSSALSAEASAYILALVFGEKMYLAKETRAAYSQTGVIHLIAISGLHIGILSQFIGWLCFPFLRFRHGQWIRNSLRIILLWGFAFLTGLQASAVRAVVVFSLLDSSQLSKRPQPSFHRLVLSAWILLLFHPPYLKELGFQLSYLAVLGILIVTSWAKPFIHKQKGWVRKGAQFIVVSIGAQAAVAPIVLYTFHQFPLFFILSNLLLFPLFILALYWAFLLAPLILLDMAPYWMVSLYNPLISGMHSIVNYMAQLESLITTPFSLSLLSVIMLYILALAACLGWKKKQPYNWNPLLLTLVGCFFFQGYYINKNWKPNTLWILHQHRKTVLIQYQNQNAHIFTDMEETLLPSLLASFKRQYPIEELNIDSLSHWMDFQSKRVLVLDFKEEIPYDFPKTDILLLRNNPKVHLDKILKRWQPSIVIADGSNGPWDFERWQESCLKANVPFKSTRKGAVQISL